MNAPRSGCAINLTLEALGDRWSLIVIRDLMFGNRRHFRALLTRSEERIASNILADRLTRRPYHEPRNRIDCPADRSPSIGARRDRQKNPCAAWRVACDGHAGRGPANAAAKITATPAIRIIPMILLSVRAHGAKPAVIENIEQG